MITAVKQLTDEAHEIVCNIRAAALNMEITYQQRDELIKLVMTDVHSKIELAAFLLHDWTGNYRPSTPMATAK